MGIMTPSMLRVIKSLRLWDEARVGKAEPTSSPRNDLCPPCAAMDLEKIFSRPHSRYNGKLIMELPGTIREMRDSTCRLCQIFASMCPSGPVDDTNDHKHFQLRAFSAKLLFARVARKYMMQAPDAIMLGIVRARTQIPNESYPALPNSKLFNAFYEPSLAETGCLGVCSASPFGVRQILPRVWDIQFGRECLAYCRTNHVRSCLAARSDGMADFNIIDCETRKIILAPTKCEYVALSYVWGAPQTASGAVSRKKKHPKLSKSPKLIHDAIEVVLQLDFRYLWIDRYCIDQEDEEEKHCQIRQMDLIYANAQLTIVAAAGKDPNHGLPGVKGTLRKSQPRITIGDRIMYSTLPHAQSALSKSMWASRGWTYQEGLLSKRRLIFTDEQVYFECNGMHCAESLILPLDEMSVQDKSRFRESVPNGAFSEKDPGKNRQDTMIYVSRFNTRTLTFPEDTLNAMQGIFRALEKGRRPLYQLLGVPIVPPEAAALDRINLKDHIQTVAGRTPEKRFLIGLSWYSEVLGERNDGFSSWTWAGWTGVVAPNLLCRNDSTADTDGAKIWIEESNESLAELPSSFDELSSFLLRRFHNETFIHIETMTFTSFLVSHASDPNSTLNRHYYPAFPVGPPNLPIGTYLQINISSGENLFVLIRDHFDRGGQHLLRKRLVGLLLDNLDGSGGWQSTVLLVEEKHDYVERVGIFRSEECRCFRVKHGVFWRELHDGERPWRGGRRRAYGERWLNELPTVRRKIRLG